MLVTLMFSVVAVNQGLFPASNTQLASRCAGAGREHSQADSPGWPVEIFQTINTMLSLGTGLACRQEAIGFSVFRGFELFLGCKSVIWW